MTWFDRVSVRNTEFGAEQLQISSSVSRGNLESHVREF